MVKNITALSRSSGICLRKQTREGDFSNTGHLSLKKKKVLTFSQKAEKQEITPKSTSIMTQDLKLSSNIYSEHVTVDSATVVLVVTTTTQNN